MCRRTLTHAHHGVTHGAVSDLRSLPLHELLARVGGKEDDDEGGDGDNKKPRAGAVDEVLGGNVRRGKLPKQIESVVRHSTAPHLWPELLRCPSTVGMMSTTRARARPDPGIRRAGRAQVRNNGGGAWNHDLWWSTLQPYNASAGNATRPEQLISPRFAAAINQSFGSFDAMLQRLLTAAKEHFGSGWAWLVEEPKDGKLFVSDTLNQDNPLMHVSPRDGTVRAAAGQAPALL